MQHHVCPDSYHKCKQTPMYPELCPPETPLAPSPNSPLLLHHHSGPVNGPARWSGRTRCRNTFCSWVMILNNEQRRVSAEHHDEAVTLNFGILISSLHHFIFQHLTSSSLFVPNWRNWNIVFTTTGQKDNLQTLLLRTDSKKPSNNRSVM